MDELFRIGSIYRDESDRITKVVGPFQGKWRDDMAAWVQVWDAVYGCWCADGHRLLHNGVDPSGLKLDAAGFRTLIPGELHLVNGSWEPVEDKPAKPQWLQDAKARVAEKRAADPNYGMFLRDFDALAKAAGVAPKATTIALPTPPLTTAHKSIAGLTFLGRIGHLVDPSHLLKN